MSQEKQSTLLYDVCINDIRNGFGEQALELVQALRSELKTDYDNGVDKFIKQGMLSPKANYQTILAEKVARRTNADLSELYFDECVGRTRQYQKTMENPGVASTFIETAATMFFICNHLQKRYVPKAVKAEIS